MFFLDALYPSQLIYPSDDQAIYCNKLTQGRGNHLDPPQIFQMVAHNRSSFAMATVVSKHVRHLGRHLGFLQKNIFFSKKAAYFLEISRKQLFTASNTNIINNRVEKRKIKKLQLLFSKINLRS